MSTPNKRILLIDDHPVIQTCLEQYFKTRDGYDICATTGSYDEGLALLESQKPDLAIVDISISGGNGLSLLKHARGKKLHTVSRFLILSSHHESVMARHAMAAGANGYINKQQPLDELFRAVETILNGGSDFPDVEQTMGDIESSKVGNLIQSLSARELQILEYIGNGISSLEIGKLLSISAKTVDSHKENIKEKLGISSGNDLLIFATHWLVTFSYNSDGVPTTASSLITQPKQ